MKIVAVVTGAFLLGGAAGAVTTSLTDSAEGKVAACRLEPVAEQTPSQENPWKQRGAKEGPYRYRFARSAGEMAPGF
ncbi:MAG: hypothetical protein JRG96_13340 [Deltaproteobacteria bacterium]|nr:hypothetical protein [Deltaproteobacteria bacterium]MBW2419454.1 hypothetical protein [Deltaproteobacteria bacterium]